MRKHVLFFSNHLRGPHGAAGMRSWHQARHLAQDFDVTVVIPAIDPVTARPVSPESYAPLPPEVTVRLVPVAENDRRSLKSRARYYLSAVPRQIWLGLNAPRAQIVLSMGLPITTLSIAWLSAIWHRCPLVVDVRDMPFEMAGEIGFIKNRWMLRLLIAVDTFLLRRAEQIVTNSPRYKQLLAARGLAENRITVAMIGYDGLNAPSDAQIADWRNRMKAELGPEVMVVGLFAGTMGAALPIKALIDGAAELSNDPRVGFAFLGDGQELANLQALATEQGARIWFPGRVTKQDVAAACRAADFCLYPAENGTFSGALLGNKIFDYLGAGRPILYMGHDSAVRDLILDMKAGTCFEPQDSASFAAGVVKLIDSPNHRAELTVSGTALETKGLTAAASAHKLRDLLHRILSKGQP